MMLTMTPRTMIAARTARNGRAIAIPILRTFQFLFRNRHPFQGVKTSSAKGCFTTKRFCILYGIGEVL